MEWVGVRHEEVGAFAGYRPKCVYVPGVSAASGPAFSGPKAFFGAEAGVVFGSWYGLFVCPGVGGGLRAIVFWFIGLLGGWGRSSLRMQVGVVGWRWGVG